MGGTGQQQSQPWGPPPPGHDAPTPWGPPPKRRRSRWLTIGLPVGLVVVMLAVVGILAVRGISGGIRPAQQAVDAYATALVEQRWDDAHGTLCERSAARFTAEDLAATYGEPPLTGYAVLGVSVNWSNGRTTGLATVEFTTGSGMPDRTELPLAEEGEDWRVCP